MHDNDEASGTRLLLVRHGEGVVNVNGVIGGLRGCAGLTDLGRQQVQKLTDRWVQAGFRPDVLVSSPVRRARETGDLLAAAGLSVTEDCGVCEMHLGEADGLTWNEYDAKYGRFNLEAEPSRPFAPGAESWADVLARVQGHMEELSVRHPGQTVVVVTHAGFIVASMLTLLAIPHSAERAYLDPKFTSITGWHRSASRWSLITFNDVVHLRG